MTHERLRLEGTLFQRVPLTGEDSLPLGWFAISHRVLRRKAHRRRARNKWYRLTSAHGSVFRVLRFAANLEAPPDQTATGLTAKKAGKEENPSEARSDTGSADNANPAGICIDYQGWLELNGFPEKIDAPSTLSISPAPVAGPIVGMWRHPDPSIQFASRIALLALLLGIVSLVVSFVN